MQPTERPRDAAHAATLYGDATTRRVYERLSELAGTLLEAGASVVIDAAYNRRWQREIIAAAARRAGAPLMWLDCEVPVETAVARVTARGAAGTDASDASADVVRAQAAEREPITESELVAPAGVDPPRRLCVTERELADPGFIARLA
jgi:predicted kinase